MRNWTLAVATPLLLLLAGTIASAAEFRDDAKLFKAEVALQAAKRLEAIQKSTKVPIDVETIATIGDEPIAEVTKRLASKTGDRGVFILIAKDKKKIDVVVSKEYANVFPHERRVAIHDILKNAFDKTGGPNANLVDGIEQIGVLASDAMATSGGPTRRAGVAVAPPVRQVEIPAQPAPRVAPMPQRAGPGGGGLISGLIVLGVIILVVLVVIRVIGAIFRGISGGGGYGAPPMGGPGYGPGPGGPGYGGPGYGGGGGYGGNRGGGFMSSLFGGIGGAVAGNWLYDQFSGRNRGFESHQTPGAGNVGDGSYYSGTAPTTGGTEDWVGGESTSYNDGGDAGSTGGDWGGGGTDAGAGGDWGGNDVAGGDWGGGGGGGGDGGDGGWS